MSIKWYYKKDKRYKGDTGWEPYTDVESAAIEKAYQAKKTTFHLNSTYAIDLSSDPMCQYRRDDENRWRQIKRGGDDKDEDDDDDDEKKTKKPTKTKAKKGKKVKDEDEEEEDEPLVKKTTGKRKKDEKEEEEEEEKATKKRVVDDVKTDTKSTGKKTSDIITRTGDDDISSSSTSALSIAHEELAHVEREKDAVLQQMNTAQKMWEKREKELESERDKLIKERDVALKERDTARTSLENERDVMKKKTQECERLKQELHDMRNKYTKTSTELETLRTSHDELIQQISELQTSLETIQQATQVVTRVIKQKPEVKKEKTPISTSTSTSTSSKSIPPKSPESPPPIVRAPSPSDATLSFSMTQSLSPRPMRSSSPTYDDDDDDEKLPTFTCIQDRVIIPSSTHTSHVPCYMCLWEEDRLCVGYARGRVEIWRIRDASMVSVVCEGDADDTPSSHVVSCLLSLPKHILAVSHHHYITFYQLNANGCDPHMISQMDIGAGGMCMAMYILKDGRVLCGITGNKHHRIMVLRPHDYTHLYDIPCPTDEVRQFLTLSDGRLCVAGTSVAIKGDIHHEDGAIDIFKIGDTAKDWIRQPLKNQMKVSSKEGLRCNSMTLLSDGRLIAAFEYCHCGDRTLIMYTFHGGIDALTILEARHHPSPNEKTFTSIRALLHTRYGNIQHIVACLTWEGMLLLYDVDAKKVMKSVRAHIETDLDDGSHLLPLPSGQILTLAGEGVIKAWK